MKIYCTRPGCSGPENFFPELIEKSELDTVPQKYCTTCGMPLILAGRYLPERLLGKGGFGAAFLAIDRYTPTHRQCVVKQFQPASNLSSQQLTIAQNLFTKEAEVLERLGRKHPQIPNLYAFFPLVNGQEQFFYLVQEFIDGENLETELKTKGAFSESEIKDFLTEILPVLQFVHENNTIHRDIKPSNIMRDREGKFHLLDFGAVKVTTQGLDPQTTSTGIYTPGYAPTEQMMGNPVFPCTDLYALAVTCLVLLTGKSAPELYDKNNQINWRNYLQLSDRFGNILDGMIKHNPQDRFQSAQEVLNNLNSPPITPDPLPPVTIPAPNPIPIVAPTPQPPVNTPPPTPPPTPQSFPLMRVLTSTGFVGFQGALLFIVSMSLIPSPIGLIIWGISLVAIILLVYRGIIEKWDFVVIGIVTLIPVWFWELLHRALSSWGLTEKFLIVFFPLLVAAMAVAVVVLFRLIYRLLSLFL